MGCVLSNDTTLFNDNTKKGWFEDKRASHPHKHTHTLSWKTGKFETIWICSKRNVKAVTDAGSQNDACSVDSKRVLLIHYHTQFIWVLKHLFPPFSSIYSIRLSSLFSSLLSISKPSFIPALSIPSPTPSHYQTRAYFPKNPRSNGAYPFTLHPVCLPAELQNGKHSFA